MNDLVPEPTNVGPIAGGNLRASDADRDQVATLLSTAYAEGRLTREEHDERVEQLMMAKTFDDLIPITSDLVPAPIPGRRRSPRRRAARSRSTPPVPPTPPDWMSPSSAESPRTRPLAGPAQDPFRWPCSAAWTWTCARRSSRDRRWRSVRLLVLRRPRHQGPGRASRSETRPSASSVEPT